ncbi:peptidoglycan-binding domain-containing protein [Thermosediminibacter oceani]|uniref:Peptidoglycan-binding domain 1 protein n=1 Tax=Thermosediminibacter oceani (strain ATCC BAA-1034 / DSM 16646 / JW/IW-1228P) TaxID=555079 RepID=D9RY03_THEOJ|nr:peptidoglycan-binding domain-containing protein [Thermosediminibacter oceani]ADL08227.1 Peptidoglycan-binding domain 1 protein [Thermosediminibacter oceani DSM 16646]
MQSRQAFGSRTLRRGMRGKDVAELQTKLQALGYYMGPIDGIFGRLTEMAVRRLQRDNNIRVDGIVGPQTYAILEQLIP